MTNATHPRTRLALLLMAAGFWAALAFAAKPAGETNAQVFARNRARLEKMTPEQRRAAWEKHQRFLDLPPSEQERIRNLNAEIQSLPSDKRATYRALMDRYRKWKDELPLAQRQRLEDAVPKGAAELFVVVRDIQSRQQEEERLRGYWLYPPLARRFVHTVLSRLTREEIEALDLLPPRERFEELLFYAGQLGIEPPAPPRLDRSKGKRPFTLAELLPRPDMDELLEFVKTLPRDQKEDLSDPGMGQAKLQRPLRMFYDKYPEKLAERRRKAATAGQSEADQPGKPTTPERPTQPPEQPPPKSKQSPPTDRPGSPGKIGIKPPGE